jgi:hypothetical protein
VFASSIASYERTFLAWVPAGEYLVDFDKMLKKAKKSEKTGFSRKWRFSGFRAEFSGTFAALRP